MTARVKICGITRGSDAVLAAELGASWIGFVFWPKSPRSVAPATASEILAELPPHVAGVGVFVNQAIDEVNGIADAVGLSAVQLHGDESTADCAACRRRVIRALRLRADDDVRAADGIWERTTLLVDAYDPVRYGGTGQVVDWTVAAELASRRPTLLSGGLAPHNVAAAIETVAPYGVDVSSGVEAAPGVKDPDKLRTFFAAVRSTSGTRNET